MISRLIIKVQFHYDRPSSRDQRPVTHVTQSTLVQCVTLITHVTLARHVMQDWKQGLSLTPHTSDALSRELWFRKCRAHHLMTWQGCVRSGLNVHDGGERKGGREGSINSSTKFCRPESVGGAHRYHTCGPSPAPAKPATRSGWSPDLPRRRQTWTAPHPDRRRRWAGQRWRLKVVGGVWQDNVGG